MLSSIQTVFCVSWVRIVPEGGWNKPEILFMCTPVFYFSCNTRDWIQGFMHIKKAS